MARDRDEMYSLLSRPSFDAFASAVAWEPVPIEDGDPGRDEVQVTHFEPNRITLKAHMETAGLLVLGEVTYPGWRAYVDGRRAPLYEVDGVLRAVALPAGDWKVEFRFRPLAFYGGAAVSLATLAILIGWTLFGRRRPRRGQTGGGSDVTGGRDCGIVCPA